ncbi:ABC transporter ATP-binding protein [Nakamurella flavida]|uniref:ABC transporter ATP-binding protein n=1 Tax=Nakamurella flavida TaxID=363630 RepID=A0A939C322_9ACTN|nr:ABC transporter ATP-binding protein [Nakamurella flavida]MBM9477180.1 ABC transporter ATP-binding protein [Nakamurella flavida]MDP9780129.1 ABC-type nitrate/sulfonate/bicarbonate transport system ATPase subunit [Nakamurella flavida]
MTAGRLTVDGMSVALGAGASRRPVIDGVDLDVAPGEFVAVIGPSGCGKSTLFGVLAGLIRPDHGTVALDGESITGPGHTAFMPQRDLLFPWRTVLQNAALGLEVRGVPRREARRRAGELFPRFGLAGFEDDYPAALSGGMRQRAALLRTVVQDRELLLLDEPFGALDALTRTDLQHWLQDIWTEYRWTTLLITHDIREAVQLADRVVVLSPRPASIRGIVTVDLPRPRGVGLLAHPEFVRAEQELLALLAPAA